MKTLRQEEIDVLNTIVEDVNITIDGKFLNISKDLSENLKSLTPIFVALYFKSLKHDPSNKDWKNKDKVFALNNYANLVKNLVEIHSGYGDFNKLEEYLDENNFDKVENSLAEAIGHYIVSRDLEDKHDKHYYVICSELDLLNDVNLLEFILKNKMKKVVIIAYTGLGKEEVAKENKLNGRLINLGFDTLVISATSPEYVCDAIAYSKKLDKPSIILANINS